MNRTSIRRSGMGALLGAGVFAAVSLYRSVLAEGSVLDYLGPIGMMTVIGGTVGGLVGPLIGQAWSRRGDRRREREMARRDDRGGGRMPTGADSGEFGGLEGSSERRDGGGRQPFWFTLLVGLVVGFGIGSAWGRVWVGVALGLVLALLSRRVFA